MGALALPWIVFARRIGGGLLGTIAVATVAVGAAGLIINDNPPPPPVVPSDGMANIWVDISGGSCADSPTQIAYPNNDGTECGTLNAAIGVAEPGDFIGIKGASGGGTVNYPGETLAKRTALDDRSPGCDPYGEWGTVTTVNCVQIFNEGDITFTSIINHASSLWVRGVVANNCIQCGSLANFDAREYSFHISKEQTIGNPPPGAADDAPCNCQSSQFRAARHSGDADLEVNYPDHVIWDGIDTDTAAIYGSRNIMLRGLDIGPMWYDTNTRGVSGGPDVVRIWPSGDPSVLPTNITWDGNYVHDMNRTYWCAVNNACHNDGLYIVSVRDTIVRNSFFTSVTGEMVFFENFVPTPDIDGFLFENNQVGCVQHGYPVVATPGVPNPNWPGCAVDRGIDIKNCGDDVVPDCRNMLFRYNSWYGIVGAETADAYSNVRFVGNAGRKPSASNGMCTAASWEYNAFYEPSSGACTVTGPTNATTGSTSRTSLFQNNLVPGSEDYRLAGSPGSTVADNRVTASGADYELSTDAAGNSRSNPRDAGAHER